MISGDVSWRLNGIGRRIPSHIDGRPSRPYRDHYGIPSRRRREIGRPTRHRKPGETKLLGSIEESMRRCELSDGMCVSFHHHLRNGDRVVNEVLATASRLGIKDLRIAPSALFDVHDRIIDFIKDGTVSAIEGSLNGAVGRFVSSGYLEKPVVLRSHSGRARAIQQGELRIDIAFLGVPCCDPMGNANGVIGPSAFGPCSILQADARFARKTVLITDNLVDFPCIPISIQGTDVDHIVQVDSIGDPAGILSGSLKITQDPQRLKMADLIMGVMDAAGIIKDGMSFQAGSGGISLALTRSIGEKLKRDGLKASFAVGGTTSYLVDMLREGTLGYLLDGQSFDPASVESLRTDRRHVETFVDQYANIHSGATHTEMEDVSFLSGTEVDLDFNVNVNTHSDGFLLHGIGGHQDVAYGSRFTFVMVPLVRNGNPIIKDRVLTVTTPGPLIDAIVSEAGISFNTLNARSEARQRNEDLERRCRAMGLPVMDILDMRKLALKEGTDMVPSLGEKVIGSIQYIDGTVLDKVLAIEGP